jgi:hypothetical protein
MTRPARQRPLSRLAAMPGRPQITLLACLLAAAVGGCGSDEDGTIPSGNSETLIMLLGGIEDNVAGGNCELAQKQASEFVAEVNLLPAEVDDEVKAGLQDAARRLEDLSNDPSQCEDTTGETGFDELEPTTTEPTTTTETPTTTTEPETETTTTTDTEQQEEEQPEEDEEAPAPTQPEDGGEDGTDGGTGQGTVTIEPAEEDPTSGGIGGERGPRR